MVLETRRWPRLRLVPRSCTAVRLATVVLVLLGVLVPTFASQAQEAPQPTARGIDRVCPVPGAPEVAFTDLDPTHADAVACAVGYGLVGGYDDGTYRPAVPVTRGQTASVLVAWLETATGFALTVPEEPPFTDLGETHGDAIAALHAAGIVGGRDDGTFGADEALTRGQFARVVVHAISYADVFAIDGPLPPEPDPTLTFTDIAGSSFEADILRLAGVGITTGTGDGAFSPEASVTRGQLATFLLRAADYLDRHQRWKPTAQSVVLLAELRADNGGTEPTDRPAKVVLTLTVNAFNGSLGYLADLTGLPRTLGDDARLDVRLGASGSSGPVVVQLADASQLERVRAGDGFLAGTVAEVDSAVRLADLVAAAPDAYAQLSSSQPSLRGQLVVVEPS